MSPEVLIVGAGISGLACAQSLHEAGLAVQLLDKSRGTGGRMASRRVGDGYFDHGCIAFRAVDPTFQAAVELWQRTGACAPWHPRQVRLYADGRTEPQSPPRRWVGTPRMSSLCRHLLGGLALESSCEVVEMQRQNGLWQLCCADGRRLQAANLILALPAPQAARLAAETSLATPARAAGSRPAWALLIHHQLLPDWGWDEAIGENAPLERIVRQDSKVPSAALGHLVVQMTSDWSTAYLELEPTAALAVALQDLRGLLPLTSADIIEASAHRWRFGHAGTPLPQPFYWDPERQLGACGDYFQLGNVEGAWLSGRRLASAMQAAEARFTP